MFTHYQPFYGYGNGNLMGYPYVAWVCDRFYFSNNLWLEPKTITISLPSTQEKKFESKWISKRGDAYYMRERDRRNVYIGKLSLKWAFFVNPKPDKTFESLYCKLQFGEQMQEYTVSIPYRDIVKRNILPYLLHFPRNPDCPDRYIVMALFEELKNFNETKILVLPEEPGWQEKDGKYYFASAANVIGEL